MDYETELGLSRIKIRLIADWVRSSLKITTLAFPVMKVLDTLEQDFEDGFYYVSEEDSLFANNVMAFLSEDDTGCCCIHIRQSVYDGALLGKGDCLGFICHEISHFILIYVIGIKPRMLHAYNGAFYPREIPPNTPRWKSTEWQAMALCGELMIPYDACKTMDVDTIIEKTNSSRSQAEFFAKYVATK